jgi:hypothetical protein
MDFHFYLGNHDYGYREALTDGVLCLAAGLGELGHRFTLSDTQLDPAKINILWELFSPDQARALVASGVQYGIVTTEIPDGDGFNNRRDGDWVARWEGFKIAVAGAAFVWSLVEEAVPTYAAFAPSTFVEMGYSELLLPSKRTAPPTHDFCFFGHTTPHRAEILGRLGQRASVLWFRDSFVKTSQLPAFIAMARVGIALKLSHDWPIPSATRLSRLMHAGVDVAQERTSKSTRQSRLVPQQPEGMDFVDFALERLAGDVDAEAAATLQRYRAELPMKQVMEEVLDLTLTPADRR